jgi:hypothetical protein
VVFFYLYGVVMAIAGTPNNFYVTTANRQILTQWAVSTGAVTYTLQRSTDNVNFATIASPTATSYLDTTVSVGTTYFYQVAASNVSGTSAFTTPLSAAPAPTGEQTLGSVRLMAQQRSDRVNSNFVPLPEWNGYINQAMAELYDLLVATYEEYFIATPVTLVCDGRTVSYALPDGLAPFQDQSGNTIIPQPLYKLTGVDLAVNNAQNAWVTLRRFNFTDRNDYVYANSTSTINGVFNLRYRLMGSNIQFVPTPAGNQKIQLWYIPRLRELAQDSDQTTVGISQWVEYVIVRAAKYALDKEEADTSKFDAQLMMLKDRIEASAANRDNSMPDTISNTARGSWGQGSGGPSGGW